MQENVVKEQGLVIFGGFWVRMAAYLIDAAILYLPFLMIMSYLQGVGYSYFIRGMEGMGVAPRDMVQFLQSMIPFLILFTQAWLFWIYCAAFESSPWQATIGKKVLGLKVVDAQGRRLSFWRATGRHLAKMISAFILGIGFLMVGWNSKKKGLHDMIAATLVVRQKNEA